MNESKQPATRPSSKAFDPEAHGLKRGLRRQARSTDESGGMYYVDPKLIPDGWSVEWKALTFNGQEDPQRRVHTVHAKNGWHIAPRSLFDALDPGGTSAHIERGGQVLMMREKVLTDEAVEENRRQAMMAVRSKEEQLGVAPSGGFERTARVTKSWEQSVPE